MKKACLDHIVSHCDTLLRTAEMPDFPGSANGLQVDNNGSVTRIAAAVDASLVTARMCAEAGADLLIVHHGFFWNGSQPWVGRRYETIKVLVENNIAVYSSHLPLDCHPVLGNNILLFNQLGFKKPQPFFFEKGRPMGLRTVANIERATLNTRLAKLLGSTPRLLAFGPSKCRQIGLVTGGAGGEIALAAREGVDTFITGEGPHWTYALAEELQINVFYAGHYATEVFGVQALAAHLGHQFKIPFQFLDHPTGF